VAQLKLTALGRIFEQFLEGRGPVHFERDDFDSYVEAEGSLLDDYAVSLVSGKVLCVIR